MDGLLVIPDEFFEQLQGIPDAEKQFVIQYRKQQRENLENLERLGTSTSLQAKLQDQIEEPVEVSLKGVQSGVQSGETKKPKKSRKPKQKKKRQRSEESNAQSTFTTTPVVQKRTRKLPPPHLRCVAPKARKKDTDPYDQCKRSNKLPKDTTVKEALQYFPENGPGDILYCNSHDHSHGVMPDIRDAYIAEPLEPTSSNSE